MRFRAFSVAGVVAGVLPAGAGAATVQVTENAPQYAEREEAALEFEAAPGEFNRVRIDRNGTEGGKARYDLSDDGAAITAGPGCSGGGAPGGVVSCLVPISRPSNCNRIFCSDYGRSVTLSFELGDQDDLLIASQLPAGDGGNGALTVAAGGGDGVDELHSGPTTDRFDPGPGADTVKTRQGNDFASAGAAPDGPDSFDLGDGFDALSYAGRDGSVTVVLDGLPNDGAANEGDDAVAEVVTGTPASDVLIGGDGRVEGFNGYAEELFGNGGGDELIGNGGPDLLYTATLFMPGTGPVESGAPDLLRGGAGNDVIQAGGGGDRGYGGAGNDGLFMMDGNDFGSGGRGNDSLNGEAGADRLKGGTDRDRLTGGSLGAGGDGAADRLDCGPNARDRALDVEPADRLRRCERVSSA